MCGSVVAASGFDLCFLRLKHTHSELTEEEYYKMLTKSREGLMSEVRTKLHPDDYRSNASFILTNCPDKVSNNIC